MKKGVFAYLLSLHCSIIPPFQWAFGRKNLEAQPKFKVPYKILVMYVIEIAFLSPFLITMIIIITNIHTGLNTST